MASNFKLFSHKTRDSTHLKLYGDFDGNSAHELLKAIQISASNSHEVFIDTEDLNNIYTFGREVFQNNFGVVKKQFKNLVFIGKNHNSFNY